MSNPAVLVVGHGSPNPLANRQFKKLVQTYQKRHPSWKIRLGFLELSEPSISQGLDLLIKSSKEISILPVFLFAAGHMKKDIPQIVSDFQKKHPQVQIKIAQALGPDPYMAELAYERVKSVQMKQTKTIALVVGRGAKDSKTQQDFKKLVKIFTQLGNFKKVQGCFFDVARPSFEEMLQKIILSTPKNLLVVPYFLFNGYLIGKIKEKLKLLSKENPAIQFHLTEPLGKHPLLFQLMDKRVKKIIH